jgi:hypothetical protein
MVVRDSLVKRVHKVLKAKKEFPARKDHLEQQEPLVYLDFQGFAVNREHLAILVFLEVKEHLSV